MILILSGGGNEARQFSDLLKNQGISYLCMFSDFAEAGAYGRGNAAVGRMDRQNLENFIQNHDIHGVVDVLAGESRKQSVSAMAACKLCDIPYVKLLRIPHDFDISARLMVTGSYRETADYINSHLCSVLFYALPETVREIASRVPDSSSLYTPIPRGIHFDVELALGFGIPLINVIEMDGTEGEAAVSSAIDRIQAGLLVCDGTGGVKDKLSVAAQREIPVILTHSMGIEYTCTALGNAEALEVVKSWQKVREEKQEEMGCKHKK